MGDVLSPPCFLTTLQYTKLHGIESLGIIFPTFPKNLKRLGEIGQTRRQTATT